MIELPRLMRAQLKALLPEGASLRRARGDWLVVSDAPRRSSADLLSPLAGADFLCEMRENALLIRPGPAQIVRFELEHPEPADFLSGSLLRLCGRPPCGEAVALFAAGVRLLECADVHERRVYDRRVRQLAAVCLRSSSGGAYACALIHSAIQDLKGESL